MIGESWQDQWGALVSMRNGHPAVEPGADTAD